MKGQGGMKLFGYAVFSTFIIVAIFGVYGAVDDTGTNFMTEVEGISVVTFEANESWSEPENGTILQNTCESNGEISPQANSSCTWEVEYDTSDLQYGNPIELRYLVNLGDGSGDWTIETQTGEETEEIVQEDITDTTLITTETLDFEPDNKDEVILTYDLQDSDEPDSIAPEISRSELDVDGDDETFEMGMTEAVLLLFTMLVFVGVSAILLWTSI